MNYKALFKALQTSLVVFIIGLVPSLLMMKWPYLGITVLAIFIFIWGTYMFYTLEKD